MVAFVWGRYNQQYESDPDSTSLDTPTLQYSALFHLSSFSSSILPHSPPAPRAQCPRNPSFAQEKLGAKTASAVKSMIWAPRDSVWPSLVPQEKPHHGRGSGPGTRRPLLAVRPVVIQRAVRTFCQNWMPRTGSGGPLWLHCSDAKCLARLTTALFNFEPHQCRSY